MTINLRAGFFRLLLFLVLCSCSVGNPAPTAVSVVLPTFGAEQIGVTANATEIPAERVWSVKQFGADQVSIVFSEPSCVGYQLGSVQVVSHCTGGGTVVGVQTTAMDSTGKQYTLIAGRTFSDKITVVAVELDNADNTPVPVTDGGFAIVLPGARRAIALVPIDQFGNLVGERFILK
jgi:hypothetical protein